MIIISVGINKGQVFPPREQAKGFLESKNTVIDHATGNFHYNIPIFELVIKDLNIPIMLSYNGQGVKPGDLAGIIGKNWNLSTGAVISKTVRSGNKLNTEEDIYVLAINGKMIQFLLDDQNVIPFEKNNIKIKYDHERNAWLVTDEHGIKYFFDVQEITKNGCKEEALSIYNTDHLEYTSSWYPSKISIPNGESIIFKYSTPYNGNNVHIVDSLSYFSGIQTRFIYGKPMVVRPFDMHRIQSDLRANLDRAYRAANAQYLEDKFETNISRLASFTSDPWSNTSYRAQMENLEMQRQIMGVITDLREVSTLSNGLFQVLNSLISIYGRESTPAMYLKRSIDLLVAAALDTVHVSENTYPSYVMYTTMPVYLEKIKIGGQEINFSYDVHSTFASKYRILNNITFYDDLQQKTQEIRFSNQKDLLKQVTWFDQNNLEIKQYSFSYFHENESLASSEGEVYDNADYLGFYSKKNSLPQDSVLSKLPDDNYAKTHSLKSIITPEGGEIEIDYELNRYGGVGNNNVFGGIRLRNLVLKDQTGNIDSIKYHYNASANLLYDNYLTYEWVVYPSGVKDLVIKSRAKFNGSVYSNSGNNGLLYDFVIEEHKGKGFNTFLFSVPKSSLNQPNKTFPFWLCGLRLAQAVYDKNGNLIQLQKMKYYTDMNLCNVNVIAGDWFSAGKNAFNYIKRPKRQRVLSEYYTNEEIVRGEYANFEKTLIYDDPVGLRLYYDPMEAYAYNIRPRTGYLGSSSYFLYYGGKTLMKEQVTYQFTGNVSSIPLKTHLTGTLPPGHYITKKAEFLYDTVNVDPIGVKQMKSNGDEEIIMQKNVLSFTRGTNPIIDEMRDSNYLMPVKDLRLIRQSGESTFTLVAENVLEYIDTILPDQEKIFIPRKTYRYKKGNIQVHENSLTALETSIFTAASSNYIMDSQMKYKLAKKKYIMSDKNHQELFTAYCYSKERGNVILEAKNTNSDFVACTDSYRWNLVHHELISNIHMFDSLRQLLQQYVPLIDAYYGKEIDDIYGIRYDEELIQFLKSPEFYRIGDFLEMINTSQEHFDVIHNLADSVSKFMVGKLLITIRKYSQLSIFSPMVSPLRKLTRITRDEYDLLHEAIDETLETEELKVQVDNQHKLFIVTILLKPTQSTFSLNYKIMKGNTANTKNTSIQNLIPGSWQLATFFLNAGEIQGATSLNVSIPLTNKAIALAAIVPEHTNFEATSYNGDGSVFCKFNQREEMQLYVYDADNHPIKIIDQNGNTLKEYKYNYSMMN